MFLICHVISFKHMFKGLCEFMGGSFIHHLDMLSEDWSSESGYIKFLICHVTSQKRIKEGSSNFMSSGRHTYYSSRDKMILVCHLIKQDHVIKESVDYKNIGPNVKFGGLRHCRSRDIMVLVCHVI